MTAATEAPPADAPRPSRDGRVALALVRPGVGAAVPPAHQRLDPPGDRRRHPGLRHLAPGRPRGVRAEPVHHAERPAEPARVVLPAALRASARSGPSDWWSWLRWWPAAGGSPATWPSAACWRGCSVGRSARSSSENASLKQTLDVVTRVGNDSASFPAVRLAVIVAVISVASPYLTRPVRRLGQLLVLLIAIASLYLGTTLPDGALAAVVLGWALAAFVHLAFGSPGGRPTTAQVAATLGELGVDADDVHLLPKQPSTGTAMSARDATGELMVRVLGRDEADAQLMSKFWRSLAYKDGGPDAAHSPGSRTSRRRPTCCSWPSAPTSPCRRWSSPAPPGRAPRCIASRPLPGIHLCDTDPADVTDAMLDRPVAAGLVAARGARRARPAQRQPRRRRRRRRSASTASSSRPVPRRRDGGPLTSPSCS